MRRLIPSLLLPMMLMQGCAVLGGKSTEIIKPPFPPPSEEAIDSLEQCRSPELDAWVVELFKLCQKLDGDC